MSKKTPSIKINLIFQTAYQILNMIMPLITAPYVARILGSNNVGIYSYTYTVANYFVLFAMLGINNYGSRIIARAKDDSDELNRTFSSLFYLHAITSVVAIIAYSVYIVFYSNDYKIIAIVQCMYVLGALLDINWLFFGLEQFRVTVTRNFVVRILTVISVFVFVRRETDLLLYVLIMALGTLLSQSVIWLFVRKNVKFVRVNIRSIFSHMKPMLVLFVAIFATSIYRQMDKIMLGDMSSMSQLGCYEYADKMIMFPISLITALGTVMLPRMSNLYAKGKQNDAEKIIGTSIQFAMMLSSALCFGLASISDKFSVLFFGNGYELTGTIIGYLCVTIWFISFNNIIRTQYIIPNQKDMIYVFAVCGGALINLIVNGLLIPHIGAIGAAIGSICAYLFVFIWQANSVRRDIPVGKYLKSTFSTLVVGIVMFIGVNTIDRILPVGWGYLIIEIICGASIFSIVSLLYMARFDKTNVCYSYYLRIVSRIRKIKKA